MTAKRVERIVGPDGSEAPDGIGIVGTYRIGSTPFTWIGCRVVDDATGLAVDFGGSGPEGHEADRLVEALSRGGPQRERALQRWGRGSPRG